MVIQQLQQVKIWGWADADEKIALQCSWDTTMYETTADGNARWEITITAPQAGGPHTITIKGNNTITINDVLAGEVWLCSGQSNMEMHFNNWNKNFYPDDLNNAANQQMRLFQVQRATSAYPQDDVRGHWVVCTPGEAKYFSMTAYFFGRQLQQTLKMPVGLIHTSWGGTPAETWTPGATIAGNALLQEAADKLKPSQWWPVKPGYAYNGMVHALTGFAIAGAIWYQGESNVGTAQTYASTFTAMIKAWRQAWQQNFPFYFVQIAPFAGYGNSNNSSVLREQQSKATELDNTGMIVISDLVDDINDIHPRNKKDVGLRLANVALSNTYAIPGLAHHYPTYASMKKEGNHIRIFFDNATNGLVKKGASLEGFYIAGSNKLFEPATATIEGNTILVSSAKVASPVAVRFGFTSASMPNLFSQEGLPVGLFRTDHWDEVPVIR